jgi:hypothetical protein
VLPKQSLVIFQTSVPSRVTHPAGWWVRQVVLLAVLQKVFVEIHVILRASFATGIVPLLPIAIYAPRYRLFERDYAIRHRHNIVDGYTAAHNSTLVVVCHKVHFFQRKSNLLA